MNDMKLIMENFDKKIKLKQELLKEVNLNGMTNQDILALLEEYGKSVWVVFDTETMGFDQVKNQITEIAGIAIDVGNWETDPQEIETYHKKITLSRSTTRSLDWYVQQALKTGTPLIRDPLKGRPNPFELLDMTGYFEVNPSIDPQTGKVNYGKLDASVPHVDELEALSGFYKFISKFGDNTIICAHNATFDMQMVNTRMHGKSPRYRVFDTLPLIQYFLIPTLHALAAQGNEEAIAKLDVIKNVWKNGRVVYSASLGKVRDMYGVTGQWHSALADVQMTIQVAKYVIQELKANPDLDISEFHDAAVRKKRGYKSNPAKKLKAAAGLEDMEALADQLQQHAQDAGRELSDGDALSLAKQMRAEWAREKLEKKGQGWKPSGREKRRRKIKKKDAFERSRLDPDSPEGRALEIPPTGN
jgi:DNA polymerase III epsilon subunit-like protein